MGMNAGSAFTLVVGGRSSWCEKFKPKLNLEKKNIRKWTYFSLHVSLSSAATSRNYASQILRPLTRTWPANILIDMETLKVLFRRFRKNFCLHALLEWSEWLSNKPLSSLSFTKNNICITILPLEGNSRFNIQKQINFFQESVK